MIDFVGGLLDSMLAQVDVFVCVCVSLPLSRSCLVASDRYRYRDGEGAWQLSLL